MPADPVQVDTLSSVSVFSLDLDSEHNTDEISRSASYTSLPGVPDTSQPIKRTFSDNVLNSLAQKSAKVPESVQNANVELFRRASHKTKKRMSAARFTPPTEIDAPPKERLGRRKASPDARSTKAAKGTAMKMFSRKTWLSSSRPQSPNRKEEVKNEGRQNSLTSSTLQNIALPESVVLRPSPRSSQNSDDTTTSSIDTSSIGVGSSSPTLLSNTASEYSAEFASDAGSKGISRRSSFSSLRSRASIDRMYLSIPTSIVPPLPSVSPDHLAGSTADSRRQRDPHWIAFRSIDGEFASFQAKTSMQKAKVMRTIVLPFLSKTSDSASANSLRAEDLDRRIVILNKWWTGILDLLIGTGQQSISGTDRPAFLEAVCEIMIRSEWKLPPFLSPSAASSENGHKLRKTESLDSSDSDDPEFLVRTIHQNIRNMFVQNIIQQMAFIVEKLSMRAAPASLIVFGGKTCAYAFFYCAGIADLLVRLWRIPPGTLRRVLSEYGPNTGRKAAIIARTLAPIFPPPLRALSFTSHANMSRQLQNKAQVPLNTAHIRWHGPWVNRWSGRDSDLFYIFVKHYHLLAAEHLPRHLLAEERMGIPAFVVVHAQILLNFESALYRQAGNHASDHYPSQGGDNPDAMAPLPMVIPNATRTISENRLVMLLRDSIGDRRPENLALAELLICPFQYIMKAAVRRISMYNNDACLVLCDFLEELVPLVIKYQRLNVEEEDWDFWMKVYKQMLQSQSTMTQIRLISYLYTSWPFLVTNEERKEQLVLQWLLQPAFFSQYFNHWSPMVRHYFFRLLCWRIGRCDGAASEIDVKIYRALADLLNKAWAQHQYLTADAEMQDKIPPSTNPCAPAPGRGLLIIRTDSYNRAGDFTSFDKLMPSHKNQVSPYSSQSSVLTKVPEADTQTISTKKRWNILKGISLFSAPSNARPGEVTPPSSPDLIAGQNGPVPKPPAPKVLSFRFSLEYTNARPGLPAKIKKLPLPQLPHTSQKVLDDIRKLEEPSSTEALVREIRPQKPSAAEYTTARYSGRALSEWASVVQECRNFFVRRKQEGCPGDAAVETPMIAMESFRMFG